MAEDLPEQSLTEDELFMRDDKQRLMDIEGAAEESGISDKSAYRDNPYMEHDFDEEFGTNTEDIKSSAINEVENPTVPDDGAPLDLESVDSNSMDEIDVKIENEAKLPKGIIRLSLIHI